MKYRRLTRQYAKMGMSLAQAILGRVIMARAGDQVAELWVAPPTVVLHLVDGAALSIDKALTATWSGSPSARRLQIDAMVVQARDEMHRDGVLRPVRELLEFWGEVLQEMTDNDIVEQHGAAMAEPWVRPNSWGFLERRLAGPAQG